MFAPLLLPCIKLRSSNLKTTLSTTTFSVAHDLWAPAVEIG